MSRNEDRMSGEKLVTAPHPAPAIMMMKPEMNYINPTEFIKLPSEGKYYPSGHPLSGSNSIEVRFMTAKEEDILSSRALLKKGIALERLLENVIVDKSINPQTMFVGDRSAVLVAARITGYGNDYDVNVVCPSCMEKTKYTFDLARCVDLVSNEKEEDSEKEKIKTTEENPFGDDLLQKSKILRKSQSPEISENGIFVVHLPRANVDVTCRLLTGKDEKLMAERIEMRKKAKLPEAASTDQMRLFITAIGNDTSAKTVNGFIDTMAASDARYLREVYADTVPSVNFEQIFTCSECSESIIMEVPLTAELFWFRRKIYK